MIRVTQHPLYAELVELAKDSFSEYPPSEGEVVAREFFSGRYDLNDYGEITEVVPPARTIEAMVNRYNSKDFYPCCLQVYGHLFSCKSGPWTFE